MATVVITFFIIAQIHVCKMDADYTKRQREKRWSMNSQRLEEIVAELMKPISDIRRSFNTDLSALLEEYLTEAGLHALEGEGEDEEGLAGGAAGAGVAGGVPNFAELALLLQQSACIYGRKVDFLYQHVLSVSDSLHTSSQEAEAEAEGEAEAAAARAEGPEGAGPATPRRRRRDSAAGGFGPLALEAAAGARREPGPARPPPTLPRMYLELEPRAPAPGAAPLLDYAGEPAGLADDFQVTWRLQGGLLVEDLEGGAGGERAAPRAVPLAELQAALAAAAPPDPPPAPPDPLDACDPDLADLAHLADTPDLPQLEPPAACSTPLPAPRERKRRAAAEPAPPPAKAARLLISPELRARLQQVQVFSVPGAWVARVVGARKARVLALRRARAPPEGDFRGFDISDSADIGGFAGWSASEGSVAAARAAAAARRRQDSDDDGFFDQSSTGDSDDSAAPPHQTRPAATLEGSAEWAEWRDAVVARAAAAARRGFADVRAASRRLLGAARALPAPAPCDALLRATADHPTDVSRMFLATLFLANAGKLEIVPGAPLTLNSFSVRLLPAADADDDFPDFAELVR